MPQHAPTVAGACACGDHDASMRMAIERSSAWKGMRRVTSACGSSGPVGVSMFTTRALAADFLEHGDVLDLLAGRGRDVVDDDALFVAEQFGGTAQPQDRCVN